MNKKILIAFFLIILFIVALIFINGKLGNIEVPEIISLDGAAKYCKENGGTVTVKQRGDGKDYDVCLFEDNRQCEAESLLSGDCPVGGLKVTGYITEAATYCAILGGSYEIIETEDEVEDGSCSFFNGNVCDAWDLYNGKCEKGTINPIVYQNDEFNFLLKLPRDWENKYQVVREDGENNIRYISFDYGETNLFKISVIPYLFWEKQDDKKGEYIGRNNLDVFIFEYSTDALRSDKQLGEEYLAMVSQTEKIKDTFKITKPYVFLEKQTQSGKNYTIDIMYPYVGAVEKGEVNIEINNFVESIISSFKERVSNVDAWDGENTLDIYYEPYEINERFISIRFEASEYTGGAHSNISSQSFNYDLKEGKIISLSDIFDANKDYLNIISNKTIQYLLKVNSGTGLTDEESVKGGAGPVADNFKTFTFNKDTIVFYFDANQVAVYVAGRQDVIFPFASLKDILRSDAVSNYGLK